jgi:hypothetical protein
MTGEGIVRFSVPALPTEAGPVVELRDHNLKLKGQAQPGTDISLDPGLYLASVVLPSGESEQQAIQVKSGQTVEVELGPDEAALPAESLEAHDAVMEADLPSDLVMKTGGTEASAPAQEWYCRLLRASDGTAIDAAPALVTLERTRDESGATTDFMCTAPPEAHGDLIWLQVAVPGQVPSNCLLPILSATNSQKCRVRVVAATDAIRVTALPSGHRLTDSVASYLATGHMRAAAHVAANARDLLFEKIEDPVGAALGAYALLRLGRIDEVVEDWIRNLANWTPALPDGAVIAGEQAARNGDTKEARRWLDEAVNRGTPMFADGLSLLVARKRPTTPQKQVDERLQRLFAIAKLADFAQVVVAFPGVNPLEPTESPVALEHFDPDQRWLRYR